MKLDLSVDRSLPDPLYKQIAVGVMDAVAKGRLGAGVKLPSTREISKLLGVHRKTVVQAFELLSLQGWVTSGVGQGTFVSDSPPLAGSRTGPEDFPPAPDKDGANRPAHSGPFAWEAILRRRAEFLPEVWRYWTQIPAPADSIRFTGATADPSFFPAEDFRSIMDEVFRTQGPQALDYGPPEGYGPLREWVAARLSARGVRTSPEGILIVSGSQQGLDLVSRLFFREGDCVAVEEPGYLNGFRLFQANGVRTPGVPLDQGGIRLDALEETCRRHHPRALYLMPHFQNPTGLSLAPERVAPLLEICGRHRVPLIEDQFDADLYYEGAPPVPVKATDQDDLVVLLGSFSKILFPGLRLGWLAVPGPLISPLRELKQMADFSSGLLVQCAMDLYCRRGLLDRHLDRVREIYGSRLRLMLQAMEEEFPEEVRWTRPRGGLTLWVHLPPGVESFDLLQQARREGVDFSPGAYFHPESGGADGFRLSYIRETEPRIQEGIRILGRLLKASLSRGRPAARAGPFF